MPAWESGRGNPLAGRAFLERSPRRAAKRKIYAPEAVELLGERRMGPARGSRCTTGSHSRNVALSHGDHFITAELVAAIPGRQPRAACRLSTKQRVSSRAITCRRYCRFTGGNVSKAARLAKERTDFTSCCRATNCCPMFSKGDERSGSRGPRIYFSGRRSPIRCQRPCANCASLSFRKMGSAGFRSGPSDGKIPGAVVK